MKRVGLIFKVIDVLKHPPIIQRVKMSNGKYEWFLMVPHFRDGNFFCMRSINKTKNTPMN